MLKPTLISGVLFGVAGALPVIGILNCACCSLLVGAGFLAAYLYAKDCRKAGVAFGASSGAMVGLVAGLFYAVGSTAVTVLMHMVFGAPDVEEILGWLDQVNVPIDPESMQTLERMIESFTGFLGLVIGFFLTLLLAAVFSTLGGVIGGAAFKFDPPPAPTVPPAPPVV
jgi:hypothetical protein